MTYDGTGFLGRSSGPSAKATVAGAECQSALRKDGHRGKDCDPKEAQTDPFRKCCLKMMMFC